jgi:hypothetical protein
VVQTRKWQGLETIGARPDKADKRIRRFISGYSCGREPIPVLVAPFDVEVGVPTEEEIEDAVGRLKMGKAAGPSSLRLEHMKEWLAAAIMEADTDTQRWSVFVELIQHIFRTSQLHTKISWSVLVLIPKGGGGGCRAIGLLEVVWKDVCSIIDIRLKR